MVKKRINVSFDTNIIEQNKYDFCEHSELAMLKRFVNEGKIKVYLSNVVIGELRNHCEKYAKTVMSLAKSAKTQILNGKKIGDTNIDYHGVSESFVAALGLGYILSPIKSEVVLQYAHDYINDFLKELKYETFTSENINIDIIMEDYFQSKPPFQDCQKKKYEFPDAVIVNQIIIGFSEDNPIWFVTEDNGIIDALENCEYCHIKKSLRELYQDIIQNDDEYREQYKIAEEIVKNNLLRLKKKINEQLDDDTNISLSGLQQDAHGVISGFDYDEVIIIDHTLKSLNIFYIDDFDERFITARLICEAMISADCSYNDYENAGWDSETKEYIFLDRITNREKHKAKFAVYVRLDRKGIIEKIRFHVLLGISNRVELMENIYCDKDNISDSTEDC